MKSGQITKKIIWTLFNFEGLKKILRAKVKRTKKPEINCEYAMVEPSLTNVSRETFIKMLIIY